MVVGVQLCLPPRDVRTEAGLWLDQYEFCCGKGLVEPRRSTTDTNIEHCSRLNTKAPDIGQEARVSFWGCADCTKLVSSLGENSVG